MPVEGTSTGGDIIVQILKEAGVNTVSGIISIHNIPIYDAIARHGGIRVISNRNEASASIFTRQEAESGRDYQWDWAQK
jgi:acetolactate synthase-1/2/3 large subunit